MIKIFPGIIAFLILAIVGNLLVPFLVDKLRPEFKFNLDKENKLAIVFGLVPAAIFFGAGHLMGFLQFSYFLCYLGAFLLPWILSFTNLTNSARGVLILLVNFLLSLYLQNDYFPIFAALAGITVWKILDLFSNHPTKNWNDVLPSYLWLVGIYWTHLNAQNNNFETNINLLAGLMGISLLIRAIQKLFPQITKNFFLETVFVLVFGTVAAGILVENILMMHKMLSLAVIFGGGLLLSNTLEELESGESVSSESNLIKATISLLLIGVGTFLASRLVGSLGWVILGIASLGIVKGELASYEGLFWGLRTFLQGIILQNNFNVTGINLNHPYVSAALFGGFLLVLLFWAFMKEEQYKNIFAPSLVCKAIFWAALSNFFLHEEATGSLLIATLTAALCLTLIERNGLRKNLLWLPAILICYSALSSGLFELGNNSSRTVKLIVLGIMFLLSIIGWFLFGKYRKNLLIANENS